MLYPLSYGGLGWKGARRPLLRARRRSAQATVGGRDWRPARLIGRPVTNDAGNPELHPI